MASNLTFWGESLALLGNYLYGPPATGQIVFNANPNGGDIIQIPDGLVSVPFEFTFGKKSMSVEFLSGAMTDGSRIQINSGSFAPVVYQPVLFEIDSNGSVVETTTLRAVTVSVAELSIPSALAKAFADAINTAPAIGVDATANGPIVTILTKTNSLHVEAVTGVGNAATQTKIGVLEPASVAPGNIPVLIMGVLNNTVKNFRTEVNKLTYPGGTGTNPYFHIAAGGSGATVTLANTDVNVDVKQNIPIQLAVADASVYTVTGMSGIHLPRAYNPPVIYPQNVSPLNTLGGICKSAVNLRLYTRNVFGAVSTDHPQNKTGIGFIEMVGLGYTAKSVTIANFSPSITGTGLALGMQLALSTSQAWTWSAVPSTLDAAGQAPKGAYLTDALGLVLAWWEFTAGDINTIKNMVTGNVLTLSASTLTLSLFPLA